jgi:hypothetical protein
MMLNAQVNDTPPVGRAEKKEPAARCSRLTDPEQSPLGRDVMIGEPVRHKEIVYRVQPTSTEAIVLKQRGKVDVFEAADANPLSDLGLNLFLGGPEAGRIRRGPAEQTRKHPVEM